jgi:hypothetical protein
MPSVSYSEIKLYRKCPRAHHYRYREHLRRKRPSRPAFVGTILHEMLDAYIKAKLYDGYYLDPWKVLRRVKKEWKRLFREEQEEFGDVPLTCERIFEGYLRRYRHDNLKYIASEIAIIADLTPDIRLLSKLDKIVEDKSGRRFLMDHKFHKVMPGPEERFSDIQTVLYFWNWNQTHPRGDQLDGIIWDYGRMKAPTVPALLKNGELSKRANIDTDAHTYRQAIQDNGLREKPYRAFLKHLEGKERTFFERVSLPAPSKRMIQTVVEDARADAVIFKALSKEKIAPRHMSGFNCKTCDYRTVCEAEVRGLDADFVRKRDYTVEDFQGDSKNGEDFE